MATQPQYPDVDPSLVRAIDQKVLRLYGKYALTRDDLEDLRQELFLRVLQYAHTFDPQRAQWATFIDRLLKGGVANFLRAREAGHHRFDTCELLSDVDEGEQPIEYVATVDGRRVEVHLSPNGPIGDISTDSIDLRLDVDTVLATLSPLQQRLCRLVMAGEPTTRVARILGMPRTSVYYYLEQVQLAFVAHGFENFLPIYRHF